MGGNRSGRPGSLLTPAPHKPGRTGSAASGSFDRWLRSHLGVRLLTMCMPPTDGDTFGFSKRQFRILEMMQKGAHVADSDATSVDKALGVCEALSGQVHRFAHGPGTWAENPLQRDSHRAASVLMADFSVTELNADLDFQQPRLLGRRHHRRRSGWAGRRSDDRAPRADDAGHRSQGPAGGSTAVPLRRQTDRRRTGIPGRHHRRGAVGPCVPTGRKRAGAVPLQRGARHDRGNRPDREGGSAETGPHERRRVPLPQSDHRVRTPPLPTQAGGARSARVEGRSTTRTRRSATTKGAASWWWAVATRRSTPP